MTLTKDQLQLIHELLVRHMTELDEHMTASERAKPLEFTRLTANAIALEIRGMK